jgi:hypothetical protein
VHKEQQERAKLGPEGYTNTTRAVIRLVENQLKEACIGEYTIQCDEAKSRKGGGQAPSEKVQERLQLIEKGCHTINSLKNPVPVTGRLIHNGQEVAVP